MRKHVAFRILVGLVAALMIGGTTVMADGTKLENLKQCGFNTTMMGVVMGAANYYELKLNEEMIYGLSGHAFLINIDPQLCPSDPYTWKIEESLPLIENLGLRMTDHGFYAEDSKSEERAGVERKLRNALDKGVPCSLLNMEHQIIGGYDVTGFLLGEPWGPGKSVTPGRLTFGTWKEFGQEVHVSFYTIEKVKPIARKEAIVASLDYAIDLWKNPAKHSAGGCGVGPKAYDNWIAAVPKCGAGHGNWWNAMVWSECRRMAAGYLSAIATENSGASGLCTQLKTDYLKISENLEKVSSKTMGTDEKIALLKETKELEASAINKVVKVTEVLRALQKQ